MARNNRMELLERVQAKGAEILTEAEIVTLERTDIVIRSGAAKSERRCEVGDVLMIAIGPRPVRDCTAILDEAGVPYELVGDCYRPGDFLAAIRDAAMVALSVERLSAPRPHL
jgi:hypothetical protein